MKRENPKSNILHISRTMDIGGAERIVYQLASDLKDEFASVHVASTGGAWESRLAEQGIKHHSILDVDSKNPLTVFKLFLRIRKIVKENDISIIHTHHRMAAFYVRLLKIIQPKLIHIYTAHNVFNNRLSLYRFALKKAEVIAVGEAVKKNLVNDVHIDNTTVIYNGVSLRKSTEKVAEIFNRDGVKIGCIARLSEQKGLKYLIEAMSLIEDKSITLFIVGEGELRQELETQVHRLNLDNNVVFLGYRTDVVECINSFDFMISSSLFEGLALNVIETFMNGKTIVATNIPGINEIVNEQNGLLVEVKNSTAMAQAIVRLSLDLDLRKRLEKQAKEDYKSNYSYSKFIESYRSFYDKVREGKK